MKSERKNMILIGVGVLALVAAIQFNIYRANTLIELNGQDDLSSLSNSSVARQTELGKPVKGTAKSEEKKEYDILMADPAMSQKWDINITHTTDAWSKHRALGSRNIKVCVIDTGVDIKHPDLTKNLWVNLGENGKDDSGKDKSKNGVDDDNNGYIDDIHGFNFVANNSDLTDNHGHGTHIAGAIGAVGGNGIGVSGVAPQVSLIIAKYYDPKAASNNNLYNTVRAIRYCVTVGANIINYSGGGLEPSEKEREAIALARDQGILFVAAAGNEQSNSDIKKYYPADYDLDNIISVTAIDREKNVLPSSNYGTSTVDIAAPGKNIYSTLPGGEYGHLTGTSQATAVVSGVATLILAKFPDFEAARVIRHITETGDYEPVKLNGKTKFQKRLNAYRSLAILDQGVTVNGAVTKNSASMNTQQFTVGEENNSFKNGVVAGDQLNKFNSDLRQLMNTERKPRLQ